MIDFKKDARLLPTYPYGGSDQKIRILYNDEIYMLKFADNHAKRSEISTSEVNNVTSEYVSSHIVNDAIGLSTHETILGTYGEDLVVACKDFKQDREYLSEFADYLKARYNSKDRGKYLYYYQLYETIHNVPELMAHEQMCKDQYWNTMVIDALIGNFDRHTGNWGYLVNEKTGDFRLAPMYDFGSSLFPRLSDFGRSEKMASHFSMMERCYVFPHSQLYMTVEKNGAAGYFDILCSGFDKNCVEAVKRIVPEIDLGKINTVIDNLEGLTDIQKTFYKEIIMYRYANILVPAYDCAINSSFKSDCIDRLNGMKEEITLNLLDTWIKGGEVPQTRKEVEDVAKASMKRFYGDASEMVTKKGIHHTHR